MNRLVCGATRSGKTFSQLEDLLYGKGAKMVCDPQRSISYELAKRKDKFLYDRIANTERVLPLLELRRSVHPDPLQRMKEDYDERMRFASIPMERRGLEPFTSPLIWEWLEWGLRVIQESQKPLWWLKYCYQPRSPQFVQMISQVKGETQSKGLEMAKFSRTQLRNEVSPAQRLVEPLCNDPAFIARCGRSNLEQYLREERVIIFEGFGANPETVRTILLTVIINTIRFGEQNDVPVHLVIDEAANWNLVTNDVITAIATLQKQNFDITIITQDLSFEETINRRLTQNCQRREYFRCGPDMAAIAAKDISTPQYDPYRIHSEQDHFRQLHDGYDRDGKAVYYEINETSKKYLSHSEQEKLTEKDITTLPVGVRYVNDHGRVFREKVPLIEEPYPWESLTVSKTEQKIASVIQGREYQTPSIGENETNGFLPSSTSTPQRLSKPSKSESSRRTPLLGGAFDGSNNGNGGGR